MPRRQPSGRLTVDSARVTGEAEPIDRGPGTLSRVDPPSPATQRRAGINLAACVIEVDPGDEPTPTQCAALGELVDMLGIRVRGTERRPGLCGGCGAELVDSTHGIGGERRLYRERGLCRKCGREADRV